jgi:hypothetical protein
MFEIAGAIAGFSGGGKMLSYDRFSAKEFFPLAANSALIPLNGGSFSAAILRGLYFSSAQITRRPKSLGYLLIGSSHVH